ncbi:hypothetical protein ABIE62_000887 [Porphyrobacter sp. MBR-155]|jgi:hypothetical protein|uniref:hypothetical protein n=1 Tax=Porphyrobacter sp. MBR-155 TaxID=3156464 RepID=UPI0033935691
MSKGERRELSKAEKVRARVFGVKPSEPKQIVQHATGLEPFDRQKAERHLAILRGENLRRRKEQPEPKKTEMQFGREEDFIGFMQEIAANASGSPLFDDALVEELGKFLKSHFDRARLDHTPPLPERKYVPRKDEIVPFLREVWGEWVDAEQLTMPILKDADHRAYQALQNWTRNNELPEGLRVKSASDVTSEFLERDYFRRDEIFRASSAMGRRGLKN